MRRVLSGIVLGAALIAVAQRTPASLWIGKVLRLGDSSAGVVSGLASEYELVHVEKSADGFDTWALYEKGRERDSATHRGNVIFKNGRLSYASRTWRNSADADAVQFSRMTIAAASRLVDEGWTHCSLRTDSWEEPRAQHREMRLQCGEKWLRLMVYKVEGDAEQAEITEELPSPAARNR